MIKKDTPSVKTCKFHWDIKKHNILVESGKCVSICRAGKHPLFQPTKIIKELGASVKINRFRGNDIKAAKGRLWTRLLPP